MSENLSTAKKARASQLTLDAMGRTLIATEWRVASRCGMRSARVMWLAGQSGVRLAGQSVGDSGAC